MSLFYEVCALQLELDMDLTRTSTIWKDDYNFDVVNFYKFSNMTV